MSENFSSVSYSRYYGYDIEPCKIVNTGCMYYLMMSISLNEMNSQLSTYLT